MQEELSKAELEALFRKYATPFQTNKPLPPIPFPSADAAASIPLKPESHASLLPKGASPTPSKTLIVPFRNIISRALIIRIWSASNSWVYLRLKGIFERSCRAVGVLRVSGIILPSWEGLANENFP